MYKVSKNFSVSALNWSRSRSRENLGRSRSRLGLKINSLVLVSVSDCKILFQGCPQDVKSQDRDETETVNLQDRDDTFHFPKLSRPRRDRHVPKNASRPPRVRDVQDRDHIPVSFTYMKARTLWFRVINIVISVRYRFSNTRPHLENESRLDHHSLRKISSFWQLVLIESVQRAAGHNLYTGLQDNLYRPISSHRSSVRPIQPSAGYCTSGQHMKLQVQRSRMDYTEVFFQSTCCSALEQSATVCCTSYFNHIVQETSRLYKIWPLTYQAHQLQTHTQTRWWWLIRF